MAIRPELADFVAIIMEADEEELRLIVKAVSTRRQFIKDMHTHDIEAKLCVGDRVELTGNMNPKYLTNCYAEVEDILKDSRALVHIYDASGSSRRHSALGWRGVVPIGCLRIIY